MVICMMGLMPAGGKGSRRGWRPGKALLQSNIYDMNIVLMALPGGAG
jgi:hypothetical protein